jgi:hypothetical protein
MTLEAQILLVRSSLSMLVLTTDVFVMLVVFILVSYGRSRAGSHDRVSSTAAVLVASFVGTHLATVVSSGTIAVLPRYWIAVIPAVMASLPPRAMPAPSAVDQKRKVFAVVGLTALAALSVINRHGDFYLQRDHPFYVMAERSTRAQDLHQLQIDGTRLLAATGEPIIAGLNEHFRLLYPDMGYVAETPEDVTSLVEGLPSKLPESFAILIERPYANPLIDLSETAEDEGYVLDREILRVAGFESELIIASRSEG